MSATLQNVVRSCGVVVGFGLLLACAYVLFDESIEDVRTQALTADEPAEATAVDASVSAVVVESSTRSPQVSGSLTDPVAPATGADVEVAAAPPARTVRNHQDVARMPELLAFGPEIPRVLAGLAFTWPYEWSDEDLLDAATRMGNDPAFDAARYLIQKVGFDAIWTRCSDVDLANVFYQYRDDRMLADLTGWPVERLASERVRVCALVSEEEAFSKP